MPESAVGLPKVVVIAAMEMELAPLVGSWYSCGVTLDSFGREYTIHYDVETAGPPAVGSNVLAIASGIGAKAAARAAEFVIDYFGDQKPEKLLSIGFAGALEEGLAVGSVIAASAVLDSATGQRFEAEGSGPLLVTTPEISSRAGKIELAHRTGASIVDMEAASVARVAQMSGIGFGTFKVISDELDFPMLPLRKFLTANGSFNTLSFTLWASLRPKTWPIIKKMKTNADIAADSLARAMREYLQESRN